MCRTQQQQQLAVVVDALHCIPSICSELLPFTPSMLYLPSVARLALASVQWLLLIRICLSVFCCLLGYLCMCW